MRKSTKPSFLAHVGAMLSLASFPGAPAPSRANARKSARRYPEQSTRQELRGQRRAQGGPGIELNPSTFAYEPRA